MGAAASRRWRHRQRQRRDVRESKPEKPVECYHHVCQHFLGIHGGTSPQSVPDIAERLDRGHAWPAALAVNFPRDYDEHALLLQLVSLLQHHDPSWISRLHLCGLPITSAIAMDLTLQLVDLIPEMHSFLLERSDIDVKHGVLLMRRILRQPALEFLSLSLKDTTMEPLLLAMRSPARQISHLSLAHSTMLPSDLGVLLDVLASWPQLQTLDLSSCGLTDAHVRVMCEDVNADLPCLQTLFLDKNSLTVTGADALLRKCRQRWPSVAALHLRYNEITDWLPLCGRGSSQETPALALTGNPIDIAPSNAKDGGNLIVEPMNSIAPEWDVAVHPGADIAVVDALMQPRVPSLFQLAGNAVLWLDMHRLDPGKLSASPGTPGDPAALASRQLSPSAGTPRSMSQHVRSFMNAASASARKISTPDVAADVAAGVHALPRELGLPCLRARARICFCCGLPFLQPGAPMVQETRSQFPSAVEVWMRPSCYRKWRSDNPHPPSAIDWFPEARDLIF